MKNLKSTPFYLLKNRMSLYGMTQEELGYCIGKSRYYVNSRLLGTHEFSLSDIHKICEALEIETEEIAIYFPENGVSKGLKDVKAVFA